MSGDSLGGGYSPRGEVATLMDCPHLTAAGDHHLHDTTLAVVAHGRLVDEWNGGGARLGVGATDAPRAAVAILGTGAGSTGGSGLRDGGSRCSHGKSFRLGKPRNPTIAD